MTGRAIAIAVILSVGASARGATPLAEQRVTLMLDGLPPVTLRLLLPSELIGRAPRYVDAAELALQRFGDWYGPYPDAQLTLVDGGRRGLPRHPDDIVVDTHSIEAASTGAVEAVVIDALSRRIWRPRSARDRQNAALLEGISRFSTAKALDEFYPDGHVEERRYFGGFVPYLSRGVTQSRGGAAFGVRATRSAADRAAAVMATLERYMGWSALQTGLAEFARRRGSADEQANLFAILSATSGRNLQNFDTALRSLDPVDYRVRLLGTGGALDGGRYLTIVEVERRGDPPFIETVDLMVNFEDGATIRERWDGRESSARYELESRSPAVSATIDPDQVLLLDANPANNHASRRSAAGAAAVWSARWSIWLEDLLLTSSALF
jgi:hypothetical protein